MSCWDLLVPCRDSTPSLTLLQVPQVAMKSQTSTVSPYLT